MVGGRILAEIEKPHEQRLKNCLAYEVLLKNAIMQ